MDQAPAIVATDSLTRQLARRGRWTVTLQGGYLAATQTGAVGSHPRLHTRGKCKVFSTASRRRLIYRIARMNWQKLKYTKFITLTYPDELSCRSIRRRTIDRDTFHRMMEEYLGRQVAALWRTEWQVRKTGEIEGQPMPHVHIALFAEPFIPWQIVRNRWQRAIGWKGYVRTEIELARDPGKTGRYCAKYMSEQDSLSLVIASYLSRVCGRPWGIKRPKLIPWHLEKVIEDVDPDVIVEARARAARRYPPIGQRANGGFTLLGDDVGKLYDAIEQMEWTAGRPGR
ncbi:MAG TPA: hypothetical protein VFO46_25290 [Candidatus Sulfotelmatobacter sp.]|nr:hypothetical protein [Candidatus Sulfotelmatobacter sp.]